MELLNLVKLLLFCFHLNSVYPKTKAIHSCLFNRILSIDQSLNLDDLAELWEIQKKQDLELWDCTVMTIYLNGFQRETIFMEDE